jgi:hypothetical protein
MWCGSFARRAGDLWRARHVEDGGAEFAHLGRDLYSFGDGNPASLRSFENQFRH